MLKLCNKNKFQQTDITESPCFYNAKEVCYLVEVQELINSHSSQNKSQSAQGNFLCTSLVFSSNC